MAKASRRGAKARVPSEPSPTSAFQLNAEQVEQDLVTGQHARLLEEYFGEAVYAELRSLAVQSRRAATRGGQRVLILPGIMGSTLGIPRTLLDDVIWVDPLDIWRGRLAELTLNPPHARVTSLGVIPLAYLRIKLQLQRAGLDADFHAYDWRQSLDVLGTQLARRLKGERAGEISLVCHSMGGLVARAAMAAGDRKIKRLVMLGTPNYGSFMPIQAIRGTYSLLQRVAAFDRNHTADQLAEILFTTMPGLCQMLPWPEKFSAVNLYDMGSWPVARPRPRQTVLNQARRVQDSLPPGDDRCYLVAGVNQETLTGVRVEAGRFVEEFSRLGDATVPLELARLPGTKTYYVEEEHGSLQNNSLVIRAVIDLLGRGATDVLPDQWSGPRAAVSRTKVEASPGEAPADGPSTAPRSMSDVPQGQLRNLVSELAAPPKAEAIPVAGDLTEQRMTHSLNNVVVGRRSQQRIDLHLALGSITEVNSRAVVLGVFRDVAPSGPALALDERLDGAITEFTSRRMFSANMGEIFILPTGRHLIRTDMILFAGLGTFDRFEDSVQQLVAENTIRTFIHTKVEEFATVLMGAGSGQDVSRSMENLLLGFVRGLKDADRDRRFRGITICEWDPQRYELIRRELFRLTSTSLFDDIEVAFDEVVLPAAPTGMVAPQAISPQIAPSDLISSATVSPRDAGGRLAAGKDPAYLIVREESASDLAQSDSQSPEMQLRCSLLTAGAKAAVISDLQHADRKDLDKLLARIESSSFQFAGLEQFGDDLATRVLPASVATVLRTMRGRHLVVVNDAAASRIPWETIRIDGWFPAAEGGLSRRYLAPNLSVAKWMEERRLGNRLDVLLVVDPTEDLPGAEAEGKRLRELLQRQPVVDLTEVWQGQATHERLLAEFRSGRYDVVHYAGHAFFDERNRSRSGIQCAGGKVLSGEDLSVLSKLPALVFFNACEAARVRRSGDRKGQSLPISKRIERNVSLAEAYLRGGVTNYIGTYWPVGDAAAEHFSATFYDQLVRGQSIGTALAAGRKRVRELRSVDWADYIHYGDHDFVLKLLG